MQVYILLTGDFNRADISQLTSQFHLTQMVKFPTRGERTLDLILSNLDRFYNNPERFSPFGLSDHCTVALFPKLRVKENNSACKTIRIRKLKSSSRQAFGRFLTSLDWSSLDNYNAVHDKWAYFNDLIHIGISC